MVPAAIHSYQELRDAGFSRYRIHRLCESGVIERIRIGTYADRSACDAARTAAVHGGPLACVDAARHLGLWVLDQGHDVHVWIRAHGHRRVHDGCRCIEHWDKDAPATSSRRPPVERVLMQILTCRGLEDFFVSVESALRRHMISPSGLAWLRAHAPAAARDAMALARDDADSGLESLLRWRLRHLGLEIRTQVRIVGVGRVDVMIDGRLLVEADGMQNHDDATHRHKDLVRDAVASVWGYETLRFDYQLIVHEWDLVEPAILAALARVRGA